LSDSQCNLVDGPAQPRHFIHYVQSTLRIMTDGISLIPAVPPGLQEAAQRGTLIPFVGAGVSRLAGCPNWPEFAERALRSFVAGGKFSFGQLAQIGHLNPRVKLSIAQGLQTKHKLPINFAEILKPQGGYENETGRRIYASLAQLCQTFVTTNYDEWLDTEIAATKPTVAVPGQQVTAPVTPSKRTVYHHPNDFIPANLNQTKTVWRSARSGSSTAISGQAHSTTSPTTHKS
jgi:hypothetical protein